MSQKSKVSSPKPLQSRPATANRARSSQPPSDFRLQTPDLLFVLVNMAMTADGKIATANRAAASFGSARDHEHLLELRATADAVMCGARTVDSAEINLGPGGAQFRKRRLQRGLAEYNLRVIVTGSGSVSSKAEIFKHRFSPILVLTTRRASTVQLRQLRRLATAVQVCGTREVDWPAALHWLRCEWDIRRLLCEGGGELNDALFRAGVVDEVNLTICPRIFGGRAAPTIAEGKGFATLANALPLQLRSVRRVGTELFLRFTRR